MRYACLKASTGLNMLTKLSRLASALALIIVLALFNHVDAAESSEGNRIMHTVSGKFEVNMQPQTDEAFSVGRMTIDKSYNGDLSAVGKGQMLSHMTDVKGSAGYVAIEHINGSLNGKSGSFVVQHSGTMVRGEQSLTIAIIADSGAGELSGIAGNMHIDITDGQHFYTLNYTL